MQFPDVVKFSEKLANAGKTVIVAALDGDFQRKVSNQTYFLLELAEIDKETACRPFTL